MAHVHMRHVLSGWQDTPDQAGLLPTAIAEADVAVQHAGFAASRPDDLDWMKLHVGHVVNAVDPTAEPAGPGLGYGVKRAAAGVAQHVGFAAASQGASDNVKLHAEHVTTSAGNVVQWSERIITPRRRRQRGDQRRGGGAHGRRDRDLDARDPQRDRCRRRRSGELAGRRGGLAQAEQHMEFMRQGEGLS